VKDIAIDMEKQRVYVTSDASAEDLLEVIKKTGKKTSYVGTA
jgi:copper chaperone